MIYQFGDCVLDADRGEIRRSGEVIQVMPQTLMVLRYLLDHRGRVVSRDELLAQCWPDSFVSEATLTSCLRRVREAIGQTRGGPTLIATRHRRGYQFTADVIECAAMDTPAPEIDAEAPERTVPDPSFSDAETGSSAASGRIESPDAERRQLTALFCDLVASTQLMSQLDLEDYRDVVRDYQALCANAIEPFEGRIAQYLGDGLLIYFGYPVAHEDDAQRAVWAGLDIVAAVDQTLNPRLRRTLGVSLAVRLGIHTGTVIIGGMGDDSRQEQLAVGETLAIASRLQELATPNTIVIGDVTAKLVEGYVTLEALGARQLRGAAAPRPIFRVLDRTEARIRFDVSAMRGVMPLAGREHELGLLMQRWEQAQEAQGQVVVISGEAGIGKSRLVLALKERLAEKAHYRVEWQASPHHQHTPLYPVANFIRRVLRLAPEDTPADKLAKLEQVLQQFRLPLAESAPLVADLLAFPLPADRYTPLNLSPQAHRRRTLNTLVAFLQELSERHPLLFIIEDLHWADPSTLDMLDLLIDQAPSTSILALLTCRLEFQWPWASLSYLTHMTLSRLPRAPMLEMAASVMQGHVLPQDVLDYIVDKTDGVPLFIEEMTKAIVESPHWRQTSSRGATHRQPLRALIPATLQDSLMSRLDRLEDAKVVAQYASVIGRRFSYELLAILLPLDDAILQHALSRLVAAELLHQRGRLPHATFTFKHTLTQETAYQSLLRDTRRQLHQQIGDLLAAATDDLATPEPELLAHHYAAAGLADKAIAYWSQAGRSAVSRSAHVEAITHFKQALTLLKTLPEGPERAAEELGLQTSLGAAFIAAKGYAAPEVESVYLRAQALCRQLDNHTRLLQVSFGLQAVYLTRGKLRTARQLADECLTLAERHVAPPRLPHAHFALGSTLFFLGEFILARHHLEQGVALYDPNMHRSRGLNDVGVSCLVLKAWTLWPLGYPDQALTCIQEAFHLAESLSSPFSKAYVLTCAAFVCQGCGAPRDAAMHAEASLKLAKEQEFPHWLALSTTFEGWALAQLGQMQAGCEQMRQGLQAWRATGAQQTVTYQLALLAEGYAKSDRVAEGLQAVAEGIALAEQHAEHYYLAELYRLQGELLLAQAADDDAAAQASFDQALQIARRQQAKSLELRAAMSMGRLWRRQDKPREAQALLADVYGWFTEGFETADLQAAKALIEALATEGTG